MVDASRTAEYVAFYRALETTAARPLFRDPLAERLLPRTLAIASSLARVPGLRTAIERYADWRAPGSRTSAIGRTCFIDDVVRRSVGEGIEQLVVLGAGYDCRAHRMPELAGVRVFEVDRAPTQALKRARIAAAPAETVRAVEYVTVDFARDDLRTRLLESGWSPQQRSIFIWEGVTNYLDDAAVRSVLAMIASTTLGTRVVFTYIHRGVLDGSGGFVGAQTMIDNVRRLGEPWTFGLDPATLTEFVASEGLTLEDDLGADAYRRRYHVGDAHAQAGYAFYRAAVARV